MDRSKLAQLFLDWEQTRKVLDGIEERIVTAVLEEGETVQVGNVKASYRKGITKYDNETAGKCAPAEIIAKHTRVDVSTAWAKVCEEAGIAPSVLSEGEPSVSVKMVKS